MKSKWEIKTISQIGKVFNGNSINEEYKKTHYANLLEGIPFLATKDIGYDSTIIYNNGIKIPFSHKDKFKIAPANTALICAEGGSAGRKYAITNQEVCFGNKLFALVPFENIDSKYIYYYYQSANFQNSFLTEVKGIIGGVSMSRFKGITIPVPSLSEQQQIVEKLDTAFDLIDRAKANIEKNIENAKELFQSKLIDVFQNYDHDIFEVKKIKDISTILGDGLHGTPVYDNNGEYYFINGNNLINEKIIFKDNTKRVNESQFFKYKKVLNDRTILVSINGTLGNVAFYNGEKVILGKSACYFNLKEEYDKRYIMYQIKSPIFIKYAHKEATGATIKNVSLKSMRNYNIVIPKNLAIQSMIVTQLDLLSTQTDLLQQKYQQKLANLEELKKSILEKAFKGELL